MMKSTYTVLMILIASQGLQLVAMEDKMGSVLGSYYNAAKDLAQETDMIEVEHIIKGELNRDHTDPEENEKVVQFFRVSLKKLAELKDALVATQKLRLLEEHYAKALRRFDEDELKALLVASKDSMPVFRSMGEAERHIVPQLEEAFKIKQAQSRQRAAEWAAQNSSIVQLAAPISSSEKQGKSDDQVGILSMMSNRMNGITVIEGDTEHLAPGESWDDESEQEESNSNIPKDQPNQDHPEAPLVDQERPSVKELAKKLAFLTLKKAEDAADNAPDHQQLPLNGFEDYAFGESSSEGSSDESSDGAGSVGASLVRSFLADPEKEREKKAIQRAEELCLAMLNGEDIDIPSLESSLIKDERMNAESAAALQEEVERVEKLLHEEKKAYEARAAAEHKAPAQPEGVVQISALAPEQDQRTVLEEERNRKALKVAEDLIRAALAGEKIPSLESSLIKDERMNAESAAALNAEMERVDKERLKEQLAYEARVAAESEKNENETVLKLRALREELDRIERVNNEVLEQEALVAAQEETRNREIAEEYARRKQEEDRARALEQAEEERAAEALRFERARNETARQQREVLLARMKAGLIGGQPADASAVADAAHDEQQRLEAERIAREEQEAQERADQQEQQRLHAERVAREAREAQELADQQELQRLETERLAREARVAQELVQRQQERLRLEAERLARAKGTIDDPKKSNNFFTLRKGIVAGAAFFLMHQVYKFARNRRELSQETLHFRTPEGFETTIDVH